MAISKSGDYAHELALGNIPGRSTVNKFGRNTAVGTSAEDIWTVGGVRAWLSAATLFEVLSGSTDDDEGGSGAEKIMIEGLDANFDLATEEVTLNGTSAVATTTQFIRFNRAYVTQVGTRHGTNVGLITIRVASAGATQGEIVAGKGQTEQTHYSVPRNKYALLEVARVSVDSTKTVSCDLFRREGIDSASAQAKRKLWGVTGLTGAAPPQIFDPPVMITGPADIWWDGIVASTDAGVEAGFDLVLVDA